MIGTYEQTTNDTYIHSYNTINNRRLSHTIPKLPNKPKTNNITCSHGSVRAL